MGKQSMTVLRERRAERGLVQVNFWIREEDRAAFDVAVAPFKDRASKLDPAHKPGRKPLEALRASLLGLQRIKTQKPPRPSRKPAERPSAAKPVIAMPCRLTFPVAPPANLRNAMKDDGWFYDKLTGIWTAEEAELADIWLTELTRDWQATIIG